MLSSRIVELNIGDIPITGLRIVFDIDCGYQNYVKRAQFRVYNMSDSTRNQLESQQAVTFSIMNLDMSMTLAFSGLLYSVSPRKETDGSIVTTLYCWSGSSEFTRRVKSAAFDKGLTGANVLSWIKKQSSPLEVIVSDDALSKINNKAYPKGYNTSGNLPDIIRRWATSLDIKTIIHDTEVLIGEQSPNRIDVNSASKYGMIGIPSITVQGIEVSTELNPTASVWDTIDVTAKYYELSSSDSYQVDLNNRNPSGLYRISNLRHSGDTHPSGDNAWKTTYSGILYQETDNA